MIVTALVGTSFVVTELSASVDVVMVWVVDSLEPRPVALTGGSDTVVPEKEDFVRSVHVIIAYMCVIMDMGSKRPFKCADPCKGKDWRYKRIR